MKAPFYSSLILLMAVCGCNTTSQIDTVTAGGQSFHLVMVRPSAYFGSTLRLPIQLDGKNVAKIKNADYAELALSPGTYRLTSQHRFLFGTDFPTATTTVTGSSGDRKFFVYLMEYGPKSFSYPVAPGIDMKNFGLQPQKAEWREITREQ